MESYHKSSSSRDVTHIIAEETTVGGALVVAGKLLTRLCRIRVRVAGVCVLVKLAAVLLVSIAHVLIIVAGARCADANLLLPIDGAARRTGGHCVRGALFAGILAGTAVVCPFAVCLTKTGGYNNT